MLFPNVLSEILLLTWIYAFAAMTANRKFFFLFFVIPAGFYRKSFSIYLSIRFPDYYTRGRRFAPRRRFAPLALTARA
jgi:hypothetical protein